MEENNNIPFNNGGDSDDDDLYYSNDAGIVIFTEKFLLDRGYCCGNGCKNCPYDYKAVPEPKRSQLLLNRKKSIRQSDQNIDNQNT